MADRVRLNLAMSILRLDVDCGVDVDDLKQGSFDPEQVRVLFDQLEFRTLLPRMMEAVGVDGGGPRSRDARRRGRRAARRRPLPRNGCARSRSRTSATRVEPEWDGTPGRSGLRGLGLAGGDGNVAYLDGSLLQDRDVQAAGGELVATGGPPSSRTARRS